MWKALKWILLGIGGLIVFSVLVTVLFMWRGGAFKTIENRFAGTCESFPLPAGSAEDIQVDRERGLLLVSQLDRMGTAMAAREGKPGPSGTVVGIDLNAEPWEIRNVLDSEPEKFKPHGLSLFADETGKRTLFVINHAYRDEGREVVERFVETSPGRFAHEETLNSDLLISPNDLVATGHNEVYVANDKAPDQGAGEMISANLFGAGSATVVYFNNGEASIAADDIASGGGINVSADLQTIYVAETSGQRIRVMQREADGSLTETARLPIGTSPDNIDVHPDGSLWIGAHANTMGLAMHFIQGDPAPSQVLRVEADSGASEEIYLGTGEAISASSVGVRYGNKLLIGSITAKQILVCELP